MNTIMLDDEAPGVICRWIAEPSIFMDWRERNPSYELEAHFHREHEEYVKRKYWSGPREEDYYVYPVPYSVIKGREVHTYNR